MIAIVLVTSFKSAEEESVDHISEKEGFSCLEPFARSYMRKELFLHDVSCIAKSLFFGQPRTRPSLADKVKSKIFVLDHEGLLNARFQHLQHLVIAGIITNMFEDIPITNDAECPKDDDDGNVVPNVRKGCLYG